MTDYDHSGADRQLAVFQEQVLKVSMANVDLTGQRADELRRAMSFHRSPGRMKRVETKFRVRMAECEFASATLETVVRSTKGFALYAFPDSHAISFAIPGSQTNLAFRTQTPNICGVALNTNRFDAFVVPAFRLFKSSSG